MSTAVYKLSVDWNLNGVFTDAGEDVTSRLQSLSWGYGRDYASQLRGRSTAGILEAVLDNRSGDYSSFSTASPLYGNILPGRPVKLETTAPSAVTLWRGFLDSIIPKPSIHGDDKAILRAIGPLGQIGQKEAAIAMQTSVTTDVPVAAILDDAGWSATARDLDTGKTTLERYWCDQKGAITALREVEDTEFGFLREQRDGDIAYENRHHRLVTPHTISQATFSDAAGGLTYANIEQADPLGEIFNVIESIIRDFTIGSLAVLWTLSEVPCIQPSLSRVFWAQCPNPDSPTDAVAVNAWTTPAATTDYTANSQAGGGGTNMTADIGVAVSKTGNTMKITLTNNNATTPAYITLLQARGTPITVNDPIKVSSEDSASQTAYGKRTYINPAEWLANTDEADSYTQFVLSIYKAPIPVLTLTYNANRDATHMTEALARDVSDRITIVATNDAGLGINQDFFVEAIRHKVDAHKVHWVEYDCSPASAFGGFFILDTSKLDTGRLAY